MSATGLILLLLSILLIGGCNTEAECVNRNAGMRTMHQEGVTLLNDAGNLIYINALIADDGKERAAGFQYVCQQVITTTNILFVYTQPVNSRFHMSNVKAPLDIGFFDDQGLLVKVIKMEVYRDDSRATYYAGSPYQYALETRVGFFKEKELSAGKTRLVQNSLQGDG